MLLERRTVSRKTPLDGRLEISAAAADRLRVDGPGLEVDYGGRQAAARVESLDCTCQKSGGPHAHHFVASDLLKELPPFAEVELHLSGPATGPSRTLTVVLRPAG